LEIKFIITINFSHPNFQQEFTMETSVANIGRAEDNNCIINDSLCSSHHCQIIFDKKLIIKDLGTTNGTFVNGIKIHETVIYLDDRIQIGQTTISINDKKTNPEILQQITSSVSVEKRSLEQLNTTIERCEAKSSSPKYIDRLQNMNNDPNEAGDIKSGNIKIAIIDLAIGLVLMILPIFFYCKKNNMNFALTEELKEQLFQGSGLNHFLTGLALFSVYYILLKKSPRKFSIGSKIFKN